jgi:hypothetical protein
MERRAINLPFIRVFVDYALKFNPEARTADVSIRHDFYKRFTKEYKEEEKQNDKGEVVKIINMSPHSAICSYILFQLKKQYNEQTSTMTYDYRDVIERRSLLGRIVQINLLNASYEKGEERVIKFRQAGSKINPGDTYDILSEDYFVEIEISKINAGKKSSHEKAVSEHVKSYPRDENGKIIFESNIKGQLKTLKQNCIIKKYEIKDNIAHYTLNEAVIRWHHRDYLGNSYNKLEKALSRLLKINPTLVFGTLIGLFILSVFISKWVFVICLIAIILPFYFQRVGDCLAKHLAKYILKCISKYKSKQTPQNTSNQTQNSTSSNTPPAP